MTFRKESQDITTLAEDDYLFPTRASDNTIRKLKAKYYLRPVTSYDLTLGPNMVTQYNVTQDIGNNLIAIGAKSATDNIRVGQDGTADPAFQSGRTAGDLAPTQRLGNVFAAGNEHLVNQSDSVVLGSGHWLADGSGFGNNLLGGSLNKIGAFDSYSTIVGGYSCVIDTDVNQNGGENIIVGSFEATITGEVTRSSILAGGPSANNGHYIEHPTDGKMFGNVLLGGSGNWMTDSISGDAGATRCAVIIGAEDSHLDNGPYSVILGGQQNSVELGFNSFVLGGQDNVMRSNGAGIIGGQDNSLTRTNSAIIAGRACSVANADQQVAMGYNARGGIGNALTQGTLPNNDSPGQEGRAQAVRWSGGWDQLQADGIYRAWPNRNATASDFLSAFPVTGIYTGGIWTGTAKAILFNHVTGEFATYTVTGVLRWTVAGITALVNTSVIDFNTFAVPETDVQFATNATGGNGRIYLRAVTNQLNVRCTFAALYDGVMIRTTNDI